MALSPVSGAIIVPLGPVGRYVAPLGYSHSLHALFVDGLKQMPSEETRTYNTFTYYFPFDLRTLLCFPFDLITGWKLETCNNSAFRDVTKGNATGRIRSCVHDPSL